MNTIEWKNPPAPTQVSQAALANVPDGAVVLARNEAPAVGELPETVMFRQNGRWWLAGKREALDPAEFDPGEGWNVEALRTFWVLPRP